MDEKLKLEKEKVEKAKETVSPLSPVPAAKSVRESLRPSRSVEQLSQISTEPIEVDAGDGTVLKRLRQSFMPNKLQNHHKSIELLHTRQLTSKNLELFEDVPQSQKNTRQSVSIESSLDKVMMQSPSSTNLSEHTGYRSGRSASNVPSSIDTPITREKITTTEPTSATAPYTAMTGLRNTRNSAMLLRSNSKIEPDAPSIVEERERSASSKPNSKSFKDWYINMIQDYEKGLLLPRPDKKNVPSTYRLETIFGHKSDSMDVYKRIMWIADCYEQIQSAVIWTQPEPVTVAPTLMVTVTPKLQEKKIGVIMDDTSTPGLNMVSSGKVIELVESLIFPLDQDMAYTQVFLATYRFFLNPFELFDALIRWYEVESIPDLHHRKIKKQIQYRCIRVLLAWINHHWIDFHNHPDLFERLNVFADGLVRDSFSNNQKLVHAIREQRLSWYTLQYVPMFSGGRVTEGGKPYLIEWEIEPFAHNLTMIDHLLFRKLKPDVYFQILSSPGTIDHGAFNVPLKIMLEYCQWFRMIVGYVVTSICKEDSTKKRTASLRMFIKIAKLCVALGNYTGAFAITYGLRCPSSLVWISAWEGLPTKYLDQYKELLHLTDPSQNFQNYMTVMQQIQPPAIPFLVPYMQDLLEIDATPNSFDAEDVEFLQKSIHFQKYYHLFSVAAELETFRLTPYSKELLGDRESNSMLVQHIKHISKWDDISIGSDTIFSTGHVPENVFMNSSQGLKNIKKIASMMTSVSMKESESPSSIKE